MKQKTNQATTKAAKTRAHGKLLTALKKGIALTPTGFVSERPRHCQWCECEGKMFSCWGGGKMPEIVGHHLMGYDGDNVNVAIFVCRRCHGAFHNGTITNDDVFLRFGVGCLDKKAVHYV